MAHLIRTSDGGPELVESRLKTLMVPAANFHATLTAGTETVVQLVDAADVVYGTFTLDTIDQRVSSGLITSLPSQIRFKVVSGTGRFRIEMTAGV